MASSYLFSKRFTVCLAMCLFSTVILADTINVPADHSTIQAAIIAAVNGDTIIVQPGTYVENINFNGEDIILTSTDPKDPNVVAATIIDGGSNGSVVRFSGDETSTSILTGFTITNGYDSRGAGGILGGGPQTKVANCVITGNIAGFGGGGGLYMCNSSIINCTISNNYAGRFGGGGLHMCNGTIAKSTISGNTAHDSDGGGLYMCNGLVTNCTITGNTASAGGGLAYCDGSIVNCLISGNTAHTNGGGLYDCDSTIIHCAITDNTADWGGGLSMCDGSIVNCTIAGNGFGGMQDCDGTITNCIIWNNRGPEIDLDSTLAYSCIQGWIGGGTGMIASDPLFADAENGDFHLKSQYGRWDPNMLQWVYDAVTSSCLDTGDPASDWTAELWPHGSSINMGAYGGTAEASMSLNPVHPFGNVADLNHDDEVSLIDLILISEDWLYEKYLLDTDLNRNGKVDMADLSEFCAQWLWQQE